MHIRGPHLYIKSAKTIVDIKYRVLTIAFVFLFMFGSVFVRLARVMLLGHDVVLNTKGVPEFKTQRANILDRNGNILATQIITASVFINAKVVINKDEVIEKIR